MLTFAPRVILTSFTNSTLELQADLYLCRGPFLQCVCDIVWTYCELSLPFPSRLVSQLSLLEWSNWQLLSVLRKMIPVPFYAIVEFNGQVGIEHLLGWHQRLGCVCVCVCVCDCVCVCACHCVCVCAILGLPSCECLESTLALYVILDPYEKFIDLSNQLCSFGWPAGPSSVLCRKNFNVTYYTLNFSAKFCCTYQAYKHHWPLPRQSYWPCIRRKAKPIDLFSHTLFKWLG